MPDDNDGEANAVTRAPGPRTLADLITEDSDIIIERDEGTGGERPAMNHGAMDIVKKDSAYQRCYNAVMEQEQKDIERALLRHAESDTGKAGESRYDKRQEELFGEFVRTEGVLEAPAQPSKPRARHSIGRGQRVRNRRPGKSPMAIRNPDTLKRPPNNITPARWQPESTPGNWRQRTGRDKYSGVPTNHEPQVIPPVLAGVLVL